MITIERHDEYLAAITAALPHCDGILATTEPLRGLSASGALTPTKRTYLSINRTGLAGSVFELDDRLVASVAAAAVEGWSGVKLMTRIAMDDERGAEPLQLLGKVLEEARTAGLEAMIEAVVWRGGADVTAQLRHRARRGRRPRPRCAAPQGAGSRGAIGRRAGRRGRPGGRERRGAGPLPRRSAPAPRRGGGVRGGPRRDGRGRRGPRDRPRQFLNEEDPGATAASFASIVRGS